MKRRIGERYLDETPLRMISSGGGDDVADGLVKVPTAPFLEAYDDHHDHQAESLDDEAVTRVGTSAEYSFSSPSLPAASLSRRWQSCLRCTSVNPSSIGSLCGARQGWTRWHSPRPVRSVISRLSSLASASSSYASLVCAASGRLFGTNRWQRVRGDTEKRAASDAHVSSSVGRRNSSGNRRCHETRAASLIQRLLRAAFIGVSLVVLLALLGVLLDLAVDVAIHALGDNLGAAVLAELEGVQAPWLDCDCAGKVPMGDVAFAGTVPPEAAQVLERHLDVVTVATDRGCHVCAPSAVRIGAAGEHVVGGDDDEGSLFHDARLRPVSRLVRATQALAAHLYDTFADVAAVLYPRLTMVVMWCRHAYDASIEQHRMSQLWQRQNRGVAGGAVTDVLTGVPSSLPLLPMPLLGLPDGPWADHYAEPRTMTVPYKSSFLVVADHKEARLACAVRAPLSRLFLHRQALPWMSITAASHRTREEWRADPKGRASLLPFPVPPSEGEQQRLRDNSHAAPHYLDGGRDAPEISIAVTDQTKNFYSYLCADVPNVSAAGAVYHLDPLRALLLKGSDASAKNQSMAASQCTGCVFHCVHPRLLRRHRRHAEPADTKAPTEDEDEDESPAEPLSWDVSLEDVDAGHVRVATGSSAAATAADGDEDDDDNATTVTVTREDLFTCKVLNPSRKRDTSAPGKNGAHDDTNRMLLLSVDVWLSHAGGGTPLFFSNNTHTSPRLHGDNDSTDASLVRLLPLHTAAIYGESLQSFPGYAMRPSYWLQYDAVYLQNTIRRPDRLSSLLAAASRRRGSGVAKPKTQFSTWTVTHYYMRDFQLIVYLNQLRRQQGAQANTSVSVTAQDAPVALPWIPPPNGGAARRATATGALARLAFEVLHGADPLLLPMHGENLHMPPLPVSWRPPTPKEWGRGRPGSAEETRLPFSGATGRIPAIVAAISHCWHARMWWLSELSRYYPVHNYGRCAIPSPAPLPGDATPTRGIPQRARFPFPSECSAKALRRHHESALASMQATYGRVRSDGPGSAARPMTHVGRDHELRCVFRKYRYVLAFENTIEDDYVTEKVYNALLSGALPLYIGAMNIADYVPHTPGRVPSHGLSVIPVLQMFPVLNETAWRMEERRVLDLLEEDEAVSRHVLRSHAEVLRARSAATQCANRTTRIAAKGSDSAIRMAEIVATALEEVAAQTPHAVANEHYLLYTSNETAVAAGQTAGKNKPPKSAPHGTDYLGNCRSAFGAAVPSFTSPAGVWPPESALQHTSLPEQETTPFTGQSGGDAARRTAAQSPSTDAYCVGYGQQEYLRRVHADVREAAEAAARMPARSSSSTETLRTTVTSVPAPGLDARNSSHRYFAAPVNGSRTRRRRVRYKAVEDWALTANTAWGFSEDVNSTARLCKSTATTAHLPRAVQRFPEASGKTPAQQDYTAEGDMYSRYFYRRSVPPTPAYERELAATAASAGRRNASSPPPMNGFAQLAAYLRSLDADPTLVEDAGFFDWWRAERMEDYGDAFLEKLYTPHPVCSICAAALEKKEAQTRT